MTIDQIAAIRPNKKNCVFPVGIIIIIIFFEIILFAWNTFYKTRTGKSTVVSRPVAPSFSLVNNLILADVLSAARERYKNKNWKHFSGCKILFQKSRNDTKKIRVGDPNLGTVGNRKHIFFLAL